MPQFDFSNATAFGRQGFSASSWKPTNRLYQLTKAVAYGGSLLPTKPRHTNSSYALDIFAPHLSCVRADDSDLINISQNISEWKAYAGSIASNEYIAWTRGPGNPSGGYNISIGELPATFDLINAQDPSKIFVYAKLTEGFNNTTDGEGELDKTFNEVLTSCSFQNASYSLSFEFVNGVQSLSVQSMHPTTDSVVNFESVDFENPALQSVWSYTSLIIAYIEVLIGWVSAGYQGGPEVINGTTILSTNLGKYLLSQGTSDPRNQTFEELPDVFQRGLEELFFNMTFSMLSEPTFL